MHLSKLAALIPIDIQQGFDLIKAKRNNPAMEDNGRLLLSAWRQTASLILHVQHDSISPQGLFHPAQPGHDFRVGFAPLAGELLINKSVNSAFIGTDLDLRLRREKIDTVVLFGLTTDMCVSTTARHASNLGYNTIVVDDACACFSVKDKQGEISAEDMHRLHLATLAQEFATVVTTDVFLKNLTG